ncbi:hypothetical protein E8E14_003414 [Neopestalotiopsis sp. 37M]|nr:hypothetical protein E8E14_003414 [Neopestalotiopsis sp. 37M]
MDWHDSTCRRLDLADFGDGMCCMRCGSVCPTHPILPHIKHQSEIRLLRVMPGSFEARVECEIVKVDLSLLPEYEAISYTWADETGDASHCQTISISGKPFQITKNCEMALKRVRMRYYTRTVWIDAICINQDDNLERGHQVGCMPEIYSRAKCVLIYVGEHPPSNLAVSSMDRGISDDKSSLETVCWPALLSKRYFTRLWILQEVALARRATLIWGGLSFAWSSILAKRESFILYEIPPVLYPFDYTTFSSPVEILHLLLVARSCHASDPRDKIFALLGLLPSRRIGDIDADYSIMARELYIRVAVYLAINIDWSQILFHAGTESQEAGLVPSLPSWVPDWTAPLSQKFRSDIIDSQIKSGFLPSATVPPLDIIYNEAEQSINMKVLHRPNWKDEWSVYTGNWKEMCELSVKYLWFPTGLESLYERISHIRAEFNRKHNIQIMVDEVDLHMKSKSLAIEMKKIGASRYSLTALPEQYPSSLQFRGILMDSAVQFLTMTSVQQNLRTLINMTQHCCLVPISYWSANNKSLLEMVHLVEDYANQLEPLHDQELEYLWMKKFMAGELVELKNTTVFRDESGAVAPDDIQELMKRLNDGLWRMFVRCFCIRPKIIEIV